MPHKDETHLGTNQQEDTESSKVESNRDPSIKKVSCPRCYAFVPANRPECTSCGKSLKEFKKKLTPKEISAINKLKILGWLQIAAAFVIAFFVLSAAFSQIGIFDLLIGLIAIGLNGLAGWYLLKGNILGYRLSIINQGLQTIVIVSSSFVYGYSGIGGIYILFQSGLDEWALGFNANVNPGFRFLMGDIPPPYVFGVDVLAVFFIVVLLFGIKIMKKISY